MCTHQHDTLSVTDPLLLPLFLASPSFSLSLSLSLSLSPLPSLQDYDKVAVLQAAKLVEFGPPAELLRNGHDGPFSKLIDRTGMGPGPQSEPKGSTQHLVMVGPARC